MRGKMKGLSLAGIAMIAIIMFSGILVLLIASSGFTPIYYHSLPEIDYIDLLSSYLHAKTNIERTLEENFENFISTITKYPIEWENWDSYELFEKDFEEEFARKLKKVGEEYFGSTYNIDFVNIKFESVESEVNCEDSKIFWNYTYRIILQKKLAGVNVMDEIDTKNNISVEADYLNLEEVYNCARKFFENIAEKNFSFTKESKYNLEFALTENFREILEEIEECKSFTKKLDVKVSCPEECSCDSINYGNVTLILEDKIAFSWKYKNFVCGEKINSCNTGSDCDGKDCISHICSFCSLNSLGKACSPSGSSEELGTHVCYLTDSGLYKCLRYFRNVEYSLNEKHLLSKKIDLNCGKGKYKFKISGLPSYYLKYNGIKINPGELDLCDFSKIPRVNGKLEIYAIDNSYGYKIDEIEINFDLSDFIEELNRRMSNLEPYRFSSMECDELKNSLSSMLTNVINQILTDFRKDKADFMEGYKFNINANICSSGTITPSKKYGIVEVEIKDDSDRVITNLFYEVEFSYS